MYDFVDKGGRHIALRPELTASVCRAFVQHRPLTPWKVWYAGSQFRYEKPQRGRYRQFDQVGIEVLGADDPNLDVEVIALGWEFYRALGLTRVTLRLNSLGEPDDRARYVAALRAYFESHRICRPTARPCSKRTRSGCSIRSGPTTEIIAGCAHRRVIQRQCRRPFTAVQAGLSAVGVPYVVDETLVRGLDYCRHTTFEYQGGTFDSAQNGLGGGGRYDGLVESLGGPATHGIGFALGLDRTLIACDDEGVFPAMPLALDAFIVDTTGGVEALRLTTELRAAGLTADRAYENRSMKAQMKVADRSGAAVAIIIGSNEVAEGAVTVRPLRTDDGQQTIARSTLIDYLKKERP